MGDDKNIFRVVDSGGNITAVQIPWAFWQRMEPLLAPLLRPAAAPPTQAEGPLRDFDAFMACWDFSYPYSPAVCCPHCGARTDDWRKDGGRHFLLVNANIGGLLVFHCISCGTTVRQKHFRDHVAFEHTTPRA